MTTPTEVQVPMDARDPVDEARRVDESLTAAQKLYMKRQKRNLYMKGYRSHQKIIPTFAGLQRYRGSTLRFTSSNGTPLSASIVENELRMTADHGEGMMQEAIHVLPEDLKLRRKFVKDAVLLCYQTCLMNRSLIK